MNWKRNQKTELARLVGMSPQNLWKIIEGKRGVAPDMAKRLETASEKVLGFAILRNCWMYREEYPHPLLKPMEK